MVDIKNFKIALKYHESNNLVDAEKIYRNIINLSPEHSDTLYLLGTLYAQQKKFSLAIKYLNKSIRVNNLNADAFYNLANVYKSKNNLDKAIKNYESALKINNKYLNAYLNLGHIYHTQKKYNESIELYSSILSINKNHTDALNNIGIVYIDTKDYPKAISYLLKSLSLKNDDYRPHYNVGNAYLETKNYEKSIEHFLKAIKIKPFYPMAFNSLGFVYKKINKFNEAVGCFKKSIEQNPSYIPAKLNYGNILDLNCQHQEAIDSYRDAIKINNDTLSVRWALLNTFPVIYKNTNEIKEYKNHFIKEIKNIQKYIKNKNNFNKVDVLNGLLNSTNFYLHYQGLDNIELQKKYANLIEILIKNIYKKTFLVKKNKRSNSKIKIGFVSPCFVEHSISNTHKNFYLKLKKNIFETYIYHIDDESDNFTEYVKKNVNYFYQGNNPDEVIKKIESDKLDVLIYIDIGMHPLIQILSAFRFAKIQINGNGQPVTSGFKYIDYVISAELMEPKNAEDHYTENLIKLSNSGQCYEEPIIEKNEKQENEIPILFNMQNLFKLLPDEDQIYIDIIKSINNCEIWFVEARNKKATDEFRIRLKKIFDLNSIEYDKFIKIKKRRSQKKFFELINQSDIILDSFNWSGNNTSHQAISLSKNIVTMPGPFMRSRHTYALLKQININETIASDKNNYVKIIKNLITDKNKRKALEGKIQKNKHLLFNDKKPINDFEKFLCKLAN